MGQNSKIEWTDHTFNPWRGCQKVSAGCTNCYAERMSCRNPAVLGEWGPNGTRVLASESYWRQPLKWDRVAQLAADMYQAALRSPRHAAKLADGTMTYSGRPRVFCGSLCDVFEHRIDHDRFDLNGWRDRLWAVIAATPNLDWLLLTKRPENAMQMLPSWWVGSHCGTCSGNGIEEIYRCPECQGTSKPHWPANVWLGTSVEDQVAAERRIPELLKIPARVRFLSCEPLLGPLDLSQWLVAGKTNWINDHNGGRNRSAYGIGWAISGGESGLNARPSHPDWFRGLRDQCQAAGVPFFFKQWGEWYPSVVHPSPDKKLPRGLNRVGFEDGTTLWRIGKARAGRLLDGREWNEVPK